MPAMDTNAMADGIFKSVSGFVERRLEPVWSNLSTVLRHSERHDERIAELERRLDALERKQAQKSGAVYLTKAGR